MGVYFQQRALKNELGVTSGSLYYSRLRRSRLGHIIVCIILLSIIDIEVPVSVSAATIKPDSFNVSLNSIATFTCSSLGAYFLVFTINEVSVTDSVNNNRGLSQGSPEVIDEIRYKNLTVEAKVINNNTNISCIRLPGEIKAEPALLRIQGNKQCNVSI